ncbi:sialate O-acetylesterase [Spirosoma jeollabukense]
MNKLCTSLFFSLYCFCASAQVTFNQIPRDLQLYPRDANSQAEVTVSGTVNSTGYAKIAMQVLRDKTVSKVVSQSIVPASSNTVFRLSTVIKAEPVEYSFRIYLYKGSDSTLVAERKRIVCGDVYIIHGQSNALGWAGLDTTYSTNFDDTYLRTCTYPDSSKNIPAEMAWYPAKQPYRSVGAIGLTLQKLILQTYGIPTCVLNGAVGGANIDDLIARDPNNHANTFSAYGQLLYRAQWANVAKQAKAIIWRQGEAETGGNPAGYDEKFKVLYNQFREDYGDVRLYVGQINILANPQNGSAALRDFQRRTKFLFKNVETIATVGTPGYDGIHYTPASYQRLAFEQFRQIARDVYGSKDTIQINSPDIKKAFYNARKDTITLVFDDQMQMVWQGDTTLYNTKTGAKVVTRYQKDYFSLDGNPWWVTNGSASGNRIILSLFASARAKTIRYLPAFFSDNFSAFYDGPTLRNTRGMRAFSFDEVPIADALAPVTSLSAKALSDKQVQLTWTSPSADQNQILERANGAPTNFIKIASLNGTTAIYNDATLPDPLGTYYYRLRLYTNASESPYSNIASARPLILGVEPSEPAVQMYPNPLLTDRLLHFTADKITFTGIIIRDILGKAVKSWSGVARNSFSIGLDNLESGTYVAEVQTADDRILRQRIVIRY